MAELLGCVVVCSAIAGCRFPIALCFQRREGRDGRGELEGCDRGLVNCQFGGVWGGCVVGCLGRTLTTRAPKRSMVLRTSGCSARVGSIGWGGCGGGDWADVVRGGSSAVWDSDGEEDEGAGAAAGDGVGDDCWAGTSPSRMRAWVGRFSSAVRISSRAFCTVWAKAMACGGAWKIAWVSVSSTRRRREMIGAAAGLARARSKMPAWIAGRSAVLQAGPCGVVDGGDDEDVGDSVSSRRGVGAAGGEGGLGASDSGWTGTFAVACGGACGG